MQRRPAVADVDVVAVEGDVDGAEIALDAAALGDEPPQPLGERCAARVDANERKRLELVVALDQLVRDAGERTRDGLGVEQRLRCRAAGEMRLHRAPFRPRWTG